MNPDRFGPALFATAAVVAAAWGAGLALSPALVPPGRRAERAAWGLAAGLALLATGAAVAYSAAVRTPALGPILFTPAAWWLGRRFALGGDRETPPASKGMASRALAAALIAAALFGVLAYAVRALTEPIWSNDYLAIWGLKGKTLFAERAIPLRLFTWSSFEFSNPGYPLGLPLLYAGVASILGRWEDHALALLFPCWQAGTMLALFGWLRRRGASAPLALSAAAALANFQPLYGAPLTGMAEVPLAFALLLLATALADALDATDGGANRRLAVASWIAAGTKNEGLFYVALGALLLAATVVTRREPGSLRRVGVALLAPAAACALLHRLAVGGHPVRGVYLSYLRHPDLGARLLEALRATWTVHVRPAWLPLAAVLLLVLVGRSVLAGNRLLLLCGLSLAVFLFLPALCPYGPLWLVTWTQGRTAAALAPVLAAGIAIRLAGLWRGPSIAVETPAGAAA